MLYIFYGGQAQLIIDLKENRDILFYFHEITGNRFMNLEEAFKTIHKHERNKGAVKIFKYRNYKQNMTDEEFDKYIIDEFQKDNWKGFELKYRLEK